MWETIRRILKKMFVVWIKAQNCSTREKWLDSQKVRRYSLYPMLSKRFNKFCVTNV